MKQFVRGAGVHISVTFLDAGGAVVAPSGANVRLSYVPKGGLGGPSVVTYALGAPTSPASDWTYDWDSSVAEPSVIYGNAVTTTPNVPVSSVDFSFRLTANRANKELFGDD